MTEIRENPTIGIGALAYNAEAYLGECLDSLLAQTYPHIKIVVCEDCAQDSTREVLRAYADAHQRRIHAIFNERNLGVQANINQSIRALDGTPLVSLIAGDDYWRRDKLGLELLALRKEPNARWAYSQISTVDEEGKLLDAAPPLSHGVEDQNDLVRNLLSHNLNILNWTAELSLMQESGRFYAEDLAYISDWDFKVRLATNSGAVFCPESTVFYRRHKESITFKGDFGTYHADFIRAYREHLPVIRKLSTVDQLDVLQQQRKMLKSTVQLWLKSSLMKKNLRQILRCLYLKCLYKYAPVRQAVA